MHTKRIIPCLDVKNNRVVKAKASDELGEQLFRIYYVSNEINGKIYFRKSRSIKNGKITVFCKW